MVLLTLHFFNAFILAFHPLQVSQVEGVILVHTVELSFDSVVVADVGAKCALGSLLLFYAFSGFVFESAFPHFYLFALLVEFLKYGALPGLGVADTGLVLVASNGSD